MKKILCITFALLFVISLCSCSSQDTKSTTPEENIYILYTNDVHCGVDNNIGYEGLSEIKKTLELSGKHVLLVDSGDYLQGDAIGTLSKGESLIEIMNKVGYNFAAVGNHEFDYGMDNLIAVAKKAQFPILCCNLFDKDGNTIFKPYEIIEVAGVKIAFIGITTPSTPSESTPKIFQDDKGNWIYSFCQSDDGKDFYNCVQTNVDAAKKDGADYVIALAHLGIKDKNEHYTSSALINNTTGINIVLDAHSHSVMEKETVKNKNGEPVILTQSGTKLENVGLLTIKTDGSMETKLLSDDGLSSLIDDLQSSYQETMEQVIAKSNVDLCITDPKTELRMVRSQETNLGDLVADAYRITTGADIGLVNGGGVRADIAAGDITYGNFFETQPFGNTLSVIEASGQQIADALEISSMELPEEFGGFLQVSGIRFTIDRSIKSSVVTDNDGIVTSIGDTRRVKDIYVGDQPIDLKKTYTVASSSYILLEKGNGYTCFNDCKVIQENGPQDFQVLIDYITNNLKGVVGEEYIDPYGNGRITVIN